jgi:hypothetical protein
MTRDLLPRIVAEALASPSVHNVQPARWRIEDSAVVLFEDQSRRLAVGDPSTNDAMISLGAAAEGFRLAASLEGFGVRESRNDLPPCEGDFGPIARLHLVGGEPASPLAPFLDSRSSWRGPFSVPTPEDMQRVSALAAEDVTSVTDKSALKAVAPLFDRASYGFMRNTGFREELVSWMRLSRRHPRWAQDGLNADAMALSRFEAIAAGIVMGPAFLVLDRLGLASVLLAEGSKIASSSGLILFHRPKDEDPFDSGKHFHRLWLEIEAAGFGAAVLAALADDRDVAAKLQAEFAIPKEHRVVSAFRIGRRKGMPAARARLSLEEVLI